MNNEADKKQMEAMKVINIHNEGNCNIFKLPTVEVEQGRYEQLVAAERELDLLKLALYYSSGYSGDIDRIKDIFRIAKGKENE